MVLIMNLDGLHISKLPLNVRVDREKYFITNAGYIYIKTNDRRCFYCKEYFVDRNTHLKYCEKAPYIPSVRRTTYYPTRRDDFDPYKELKYGKGVRKYNEELCSKIIELLKHLNISATRIGEIFSISRNRASEYCNFLVRQGVLKKKLSRRLGKRGRPKVLYAFVKNVDNMEYREYGT